MEKKPLCLEETDCFFLCPSGQDSSAEARVVAAREGRGQVQWVVGGSNASSMWTCVLAVRCREHICVAADTFWRTVWWVCFFTRLHLSTGQISKGQQFTHIYIYIQRERIAGGRGAGRICMFLWPPPHTVWSTIMFFLLPAVAILCQDPGHFNQDG